MEKIEQLIIPTQDIMFAVMKDGSRICNFRDDNGKVNPIAIVKIFEAIRKEVSTCKEDLVPAFALTTLIELPQLQQAILKRMEEKE